MTTQPGYDDPGQPLVQPASPPTEILRLREVHYAGAEWIKQSLLIENLSPLGVAVADLLGDLFYGIYHLNYTSLRKVQWTDNRWMAFCHYGELATFDFDLLTRFVVLCHDRQLRGAIEGRSYHYLQLSFTARPKRDGQRYERHPTLEDNVAAIRSSYTEIVRVPVTQEARLAEEAKLWRPGDEV